MMMSRETMMISIVNDDVDNVLGEEIVDGKWGGCGPKELELSRKVGSLWFLYARVALILIITNLFVMYIMSRVNPDCDHHLIIFFIHL